MSSKYEAVKDALKKDILAGKFPIDAKLPTESKLMQQFEVSRHTVRRAVSDLENEHFIYKVQGGGMFVADWQKDWQAETKNKTIGVICTQSPTISFLRSSLGSIKSSLKMATP